MAANVVCGYRAEQMQISERDRQVESTCRKIGMYIIAFGAIDGKSNTEKQTANAGEMCGPVNY